MREFPDKCFRQMYWYLPGGPKSKPGGYRCKKLCLQLTNFDDFWHIYTIVNWQLDDVTIVSPPYTLCVTAIPWIFCSGVLLMMFGMLVPKIDTGEPCSSGELCLDANAMCSNGICQCSPLHYLSLVNGSQCCQYTYVHIHRVQEKEATLIFDITLPSVWCYNFWSIFWPHWPNVGTGHEEAVFVFRLHFCMKVVSGQNLSTKPSDPHLHLFPSTLSMVVSPLTNPGSSSVHIFSIKFPDRYRFYFWKSLSNQLVK